MRHKLIAASAAAGAMILAGLAVPDLATAAPAQPAAPTAPAAAVKPAASTITWGACANPGLTARGAQCALVAVPLDYSKPTGAKIRLAVSRIRHTVPAAQYQGVMLTNPGGPGGSGLTLSVLGEYVPKNAGAAYDWIGFDPRGVGSSIPSIHCDNSVQYAGFNRPLYIPVLQSDLLAWQNRTQAYAASCGTDNSQALLDHVTTVDSAKDMDSLRVALGASQINYYGFSYGTYLGQVYGTLFPTHLRRTVLDSNVDPTRVWYAANLDQDVAFEKNMKIWWTWIAKYNSVYHLGATEATVEAKFYSIAAKLRANPIQGKIGYDEWIDTFLYAGYYQQTWTELGAVFANYVNNKDAQGVFDEYVGSAGLDDDNGFAMYNAVECSDTQWPKSWETWATDNWRVFSQARYETWSNAWFNAPCLYWPGKAHTPTKVDGSKVGPVLLIDETLDAATPYSGSLKVRTLFPRSSLIALPGGTSHANSLYGDACLDNQIADYLLTGKLPTRKPGNNKADATCKPLPVPVPSATDLTPAAQKAAAAKTSSRAAFGLMIVPGRVG